VTRTLVTAAELPGLLRRARVDGAPVALRALRINTRGADVTIDAHNAIAEIDGALTLSAAARRIARLGAVFPLARPLPPMTLMEACAALPLLVDAWVQQATILTADGDAADTPRAPRAAMGPSLLGALCSRPPLAIALRARVRIALAAHATVRQEQLASTRHVAVRVAELLEQGRAFSVDAFGTSLLVLGDPLPSPCSSVALGARFAHEHHGRRPSFARAVSFAPGDIEAMAGALGEGGRVVAAPFIGRCGALTAAGMPAARGFGPLVILDVARGVAALTASWARGSSAQESS
jgi:hypothetical protein